jgi:hypothetical protein
LSEQQETALREKLSLRTAPEWDMKVQNLDHALVAGGTLELTGDEYQSLLAPVIRLRLRRALMHALEDGVISAPAAAQILGYLGHSRGQGALEELLDPALFPNLASPDFAFLKDIKQRLHEDLLELKAAAQDPTGDEPPRTGTAGPGR